MAEGVVPLRLTALSPWAWHGLAVPWGTATLNDVVTDAAIAFAAAAALGMMPRSPCLPSAPDYRGHLAALPFKTTLFPRPKTTASTDRWHAASTSTPSAVCRRASTPRVRRATSRTTFHPGSCYRQRLLRLFPARGSAAHRPGRLRPARRPPRGPTRIGPERGWAA